MAQKKSKRKKELKHKETISKSEFEKLKKNKNVIVKKMDFTIIRTVDINGDIIIHDPPCEVFFVTDKSKKKK